MGGLVSSGLAVSDVSFFVFVLCKITNRVSRSARNLQFVISVTFLAREDFSILA